ncbi:1-(5-phosphoribosyl)-5-[(5-phosphoribosylamino)methylideneamino]imidazole-4-carboxamide isomerase [Rhodocaloribacter litoris]|uniref:1-(5-phosphoribosyl)-5-[(5- phosphoribosylamino)methylideneamino]imidazole-4- carboxamide isomerase n=1 Tax=Rhodocaloribacter litoris TaxID=2558931 RepID=UPI00141DD4B9|nr:1-(5-phosphoribosyl)-5-[(5-phosphoribosylamino)methylideneamino]imidazole-4-carboxamide isomerase [Rhodocaloribacter litoris]QXD14962.1 1-(5-phosphoribosyl)-5-[(5-phosphoribosylamino)methylideneamino]imidazole-4-carboxamide isomerase [Rhodocaloribacter litoris]GIV58936.1 MAG: 1-(5-phosphoribosyl)-5-[(5-phosphoribosylamino) methylideneamino] imidazole-4-carboxamide isomerase [Rhodothermaceae bacterium]
MLVIPAIDIRGGRCVRLYQGSYERETVYFEDPVRMAMLWRVMNARTLHIVDLDAARGGAEHNRPIITEICRQLDIPIQLGGGLRTLEDIEAALALGVYRVVIGTAAARNPDLVSEAVERFTCSRIVVGIDAADGEVRVEGWTEGSGLDAVDLALDMEARGVRRIVYTDIGRDGTLQGPNTEAYRVLGKHLRHCRITASGGIGGYQDLLKIKELAPYRVDSVIVGRALYENRFPCQQFWCWHYKDEVDLARFSTAPLRPAAPAEPREAPC